MKKLNSDVWSNLLFFIPAIVAFSHHDYIHLLLITLVFISSFSYHYSNRKKYHSEDVLCALLLIFYNLIKLVLIKVTVIYLLIIILLACFSLLYHWLMKKDDYIWHISSALITLLVALA